MDRKKRTALNEQVYEQAGEWFLEFRDGEPDARTRSEFDSWIRRSPDHLAAYLEIAAIWNEAPALEAADKTTLIERARQDAENITPLARRVDTPVAAAAATARADVRFLARHTWHAASIVLFVLCMAAVVFWWARHPVYSTGVGEQRTIALKDGSRIELNSRSKLKILYSERERKIELMEGQALFSVARDAGRPFVVSSNNASVRAVGTRFDVYRKREGTVVTVVEGQVAIRDDRNRVRLNAVAAERAVMLSAGQQLLVTRSEIRKPVIANIASVTAWTQRQLIFDAAALSEVAEEFNRYNDRQLVIRDEDAFEFRISGVFSSADPAGLIRFLRDRPGIRVAESPSQIVIEKVKGAQPEK